MCLQHFRNQTSCNLDVFIHDEQLHMQADDLEGLTYMQKNHSCMSPTLKLQRGSRYIYIGLGTQLLNHA
jgi:hypothetical protein